jgi:hypothetical protein
MIPEGNSHGWEGGSNCVGEGEQASSWKASYHSTQGFPTSLGGFKLHYSKIFTLPYIVDCFLLEKIVFRLK